MKAKITISKQELNKANCLVSPLSGDLDVNLDLDREPREGDYCLIRMQDGTFQIVQFADLGRENIFHIERQGIANIPLDWLRPIEGTENKLYEKITSIILHPEVGNA